jgi:thioredoxin 1
MYTREGMTMKPSIDNTICVVIALLSFVFLAMVPMRSEGKEQIAQQTKPLPTLIDFGRGTCMPCKMMKPILEGLKKEYAGILNVEIIDVRYDPEAMKKYKIPGVPFQLVFDASGKEPKRRYGYADKGEILALLMSVGIDVQKAKTEKKK